MLTQLRFRGVEPRKVSSSLRRVALLGIAHRSILVKCAQKSKAEPQPKLLVESVKTIGDWINAQRERKNLTLGHVALKIGIAHALILAWESKVSGPDDQQRAGLARLHGNYRSIQI